MLCQSDELELVGSSVSAERRVFIGRSGERPLDVAFRIEPIVELVARLKATPLSPEVSRSSIIACRSAAVAVGAAAGAENSRALLFRGRGFVACRTFRLAS